jgi:glutathione S-transferase
MLTLFHHPKSRSARILILLEEIGVPYEVTRVDIRHRDGTGSLDAKNPHPHGKVPVLDHDGVVVFESPAIALYLADAFPDAKVGARERGTFLSMLAYYGDVVEPAFVSKFMNTTVPRGTAGWVVADEVLAFLDETLKNRSYIAGDTFTAADVLYATTFQLFAGSPLLPKIDSIEAYVGRCASRPSFARATTRDRG